MTPTDSADITPAKPHGALAVLDLAERFASFDDTWNPRVLAELNGQQVKVAKLEGEFVWHQHEHEDELFWVISGELEMGVRTPQPDGSVSEGSFVLGPGQLFVVPRGVEHRPVAAQGEVELVLFEPASTLNTGDAEDARRRDVLEKL